MKKNPKNKIIEKDYGIFGHLGQIRLYFVLS